MKACHKSVAVLAWILVMCHEGRGEERPVGASAAAPVPMQSVNAGLLNDWLRRQSTGFGNWDLGGQFRARSELKENGGVYPNTDFRAGGVDNHNSYLLLREKIHAGFSPCNWFSVYTEGRDSSSIGDERPRSPDEDHFALHQAYIRLGDSDTFPLTAKIGRQELIYGDERLVGNADWANVPRVFDAAKLRYQSPNLWVDAFTSRVVVPVQHQFNVANDYDWFSGIYASTVTLIPRQETQLYCLSRNASPQAASAVSEPLVTLPRARDVYTVGSRIKSLPGQWSGWDYIAEIAGQFGNVNLSVPGDGPRRLKHEALAASVLGGYTWAEAFGRPRLGLEYDFASGDGNPRDGKDQTFENLFPTNHKHYGYMDFVGWRNVHNPRLSAAIHPVRPLLLTLDYHLFWLADTHDFFYPESGPGRGASGPAGPGEPLSYGRNPQFSNFLGSEVNFEAIYAFQSWGVLRTGYGHFFAGDYIRDSLSSVGGASDANWVYLQMTVNF